MKNIGKKIIIIAIFSFLFLKHTGQIKMINNGNVAIGINYPNHSLHVYGFSQIFNYNSKEIYFRPNAGGTASFISSNLGKITFWHPAWGNNTLERGACVPNSDIRIKHDINLLSNNLNIIKQLTPKSFRFNDSIEPGNKLHYGFIAQEVISVLPAVIDTGRAGLLTMNYEAIIPFLAGAIKEQALTIDSLKAVLAGGTGARQATGNNDAEMNALKQQLNDLKSKVDYFENNCCASINTGSIQGDKSTGLINNINQNDDLLFQNMPNPFADVTTIKFNIPSKYSGNFFIKIYKISGEELMSFKINRESKELVVNAANLVNGVYNYALIINSEILIMKQMIISR